MQRCDNLVDIGKCCKMSIYLQTLMPIQKRTSPIKFGRLAAKSEKDTVPYLSTKPGGRGGAGARGLIAVNEPAPWLSLIHI